MSDELLRTLSVVAFSIAAGALVVAVILWFTLNIRNVIGFLSGRNAKRATENLLGEASKTIYKRPNVNLAKKEFANQKETPKKKKPEKKKAVPEVAPTTALDGKNTVAPTTLLASEPTTPLASEPTTPLYEGTMLLDDLETVEGTALLDDSDDVAGTTLLTPEETKHSNFVITESILMVHTDEHIRL